jgi:hypothetical protein
LSLINEYRISKALLLGKKLKQFRIHASEQMYGSYAGKKRRGDVECEN